MNAGHKINRTLNQGLADLTLTDNIYFRNHGFQLKKDTISQSKQGTHIQLDQGLADFTQTDNIYFRNHGFLVISKERSNW